MRGKSFRKKLAQYEKTRLVADLRAARERKRAEAGKCEGRKSQTFPASPSSNTPSRSTWSPAGERRCRNGTSLTGAPYHYAGAVPGAVTRSN